MICNHYIITFFLLLQPILVEEPSPQECLQLLSGLAPRYEAFHRVTLSQPALAAAVAAAQRCGVVFVLL
jgi:ATP-dependent Clp protease ATP-binding subunit ClpA